MHLKYDEMHLFHDILLKREIYNEAALSIIKRSFFYLSYIALNFNIFHPNSSNTLRKNGTCNNDNDKWNNRTFPHHTN